MPTRHLFFFFFPHPLAAHDFIFSVLTDCFSQLLIVARLEKTLALPHSFVVYVKSLLTFERLAKTMERNYVDFKYFVVCRGNLSVSHGSVNLGLHIHSHLSSTKAKALHRHHYSSLFLMHFVRLFLQLNTPGESERVDKITSRVTKCAQVETHKETMHKNQLSYLLIFWQESATGDLQSPLTPESINGTDDERIVPDASQNSEPRAETNAVPFPHRWTSEF